MSAVRKNMKIIQIRHEELRKLTTYEIYPIDKFNVGMPPRQPIKFIRIWYLLLKSPMMIASNDYKIEIVYSIL